LVGALLAVLGYYPQSPAVDYAGLRIAGLAAYDSGDFRTAADLFQRARRHDTEAEYHFGEMLFHGEGILPDTSRGARLVEDAARKGFAPAEASMSMLRLAAGDTDSARQWARLSSDQHDPVGLWQLANMARDPTGALEPLLRSASLGYAPSQFVLGLTRLKAGHDTTQVGIARKGWRTEALDWIERAAIQGLQDAQIASATALLGAAHGDTATLVEAYVFLLEAEQPHVAPFASWSPAIDSTILTVRDKLESQMTFDMIQNARERAARWHVALERHYRHGH
jgi:TPR repeat protein